MMKKLTIAIVLTIAATAHADPKAEAKVHVDAATAAHKQGDYTTALAELQTANRLDPQPDLLYAIGQVYAKLGRCAEATASYEDFRKTQKDPAIASVVDQAVAACKPREETPVTPVTTAVAPPPPPEHHRSPWYTDKLGDALVIGGVVAGVVGLVVYRGATGKLDDAEGASSLAAYNQLVDDAHNARTTSAILLAAGGALVVAGVVHYVLRDTGDDGASAGVGMVPVSSGGMITFGGQF